MLARLRRRLVLRGLTRDLDAMFKENSVDVFNFSLVMDDGRKYLVFSRVDRVTGRRDLQVTCCACKAEIKREYETWQCVAGGAKWFLGTHRAIEHTNHPCPPL